MIKIDAKHYTDTIIYSIDIIIRNLKQQLSLRIDNLNMGISGEQFVVLDTILCNPNIYQQKLSEILLKDKSNTTRVLKSLEDKKLIRRDIGSHNNRLVYFLNVTSAGKKIIKKIKPQMKEFLVEVFENITNDEIALLHSLSKKFQYDLDILIERN